ncbi:GNAT family N-acetyltransferase [Plectonema radiosum NIES-515]|uniref:GNAT family N-acetyltransferase n=1 Tax=Plectonema radiosum NIES-515 TaxID=2986073 RepID=A0ABT3B2Z6_9CYAN|nr:GNAT family N-acetyltransferase [Plectonema radiosum]MCV3215748.1 GNAT family N-acetyltransferase [Plectonema radiosum NIES-515]
MEFELPLITSDRLLLRLATKDDIPQIINYFTKNKAYLTPFYPQWNDKFFTEEYWQIQVEIDLQEFLNYLALRLFIFIQSEPTTIIGNINFRNIILGAAQFGSVGYSIAETEQSKGYMTEALNAAIQYVFQQLNLHRIMANYMPHNQRSGNLLKRLGFVVEGYARDYLLINGQWQDHILTSLINSNWQG